MHLSATIGTINIQNAFANEASRIHNLLDQYSKLAANKLSELAGTHILEHRIDILPDANPIYQGVAKIPSNLHHVIQKEVDEMLEAGIIKRSNSPWSSRLVLAPKKDGTYRLCFNYKPLNEVTTDDRHPLPRIQDLIDSLQEGRIFTTLDLKAGYWQMKVRSKDTPKTAFSTPNGHYEFLRMPFGLKTAPASFQRMIFMVLSRYVNIFVQI